MGWFSAPGMLGLVAEYLVKTTAVLALALLAAAAAKRRAAAFRHYILSSALIGLLILPLLSLVPVGWRTGLLPGRLETTKTTARPGMILGRPMEIAPTAAAGFRRSAALPVSADPGGLLRSGKPFDDPGKAVTFPADLSDAEAADSRGLQDVQLTEGAVSRNALDFALAVLWSAGLFLLVLRLAVGLAAAVKLSAEGLPLSDALWRVLLERFLAIIPLRRRVRLKSHPKIAVPLTWGWRRPVILMPAGSECWTDEERRSALYHELSHVKRADFLVMLAVRAGLAVFWWNPLSWIVYRELRKEQEIACDELVLRAGIKPSTYAASLLAFRRSAGPGWNPSAALLGLLGRSSFPERLTAILKQKLTFKEIKMRTRIMLAGAVVLAVAVIGTARPASGIASKGEAAVVDTALPAPLMPDALRPAAESPEPAVVQEKEKQKESGEKAKAGQEKAASELKLAVEAKGKDTPIVLTITQGGEVKTLTLDKPLTITTTKAGENVVLTVDGKEIQVLKGEPIRMEIKGGELRILDKGVPVKVGEGSVLKLGKTIKEGEPNIAWTIQTDKKDHNIVYYVTKEGKSFAEIKKDSNIKEGAPNVAWTLQPGKDHGLWVAKGLSGKSFYYSSIGNKDMLEKIRALQEQVQAVKAKKLDISALEESLKKLEVELKAQDEKPKELTVGIGKTEGGVAVGKAIGHAEGEARTGVWILYGDKSKVKVGVGSAEGVIQIVYGAKGATAADFERAVAKLKKDLPAGYTLTEQEFDPENGSMSFKIKGPEGAKTDGTYVRKLIESLKDELKDKK